MSNTMIDKKCAYTDWRTPTHILEAVRQYFGGPIELDPATAPDNPTGAKHYYTEGGLTQPWGAQLEPPPWTPNVFVNPPYGRDLREWCAKIGAEAYGETHIVALLPGQRFETSYWQNFILNRWLTAIVFLRGRLKFLRPDGTPAANNPYGSMLYIYNGNLERARQVFGPLGKVLAASCEEKLHDAWEKLDCLRKAVEVALECIGSVHPNVVGLKALRAALEEGK